jgi:hypothetical protein
MPTRDVDVCSRQELRQLGLAHEAIMKNHASIHTEVPATCLEHQPIGPAFTLDNVGMGGTEYEADRLGMSRQNLGQRINDILDPFVWPYEGWVFSWERPGRSSAAGRRDHRFLGLVIIW